MYYKLEFSPSSHVHLSFHVSFLKKVIGDKIPVHIILLYINEEVEIILEPKTILQTRIKQLWKQTITKYQIKWKNVPSKHVTWEDELFMHKHP